MKLPQPLKTFKTLILLSSGLILSGLTNLGHAIELGQVKGAAVMGQQLSVYVPIQKIQSSASSQLRSTCLTGYLTSIELSNTNMVETKRNPLNVNFEPTVRGGGLLHLVSHDPVVDPVIRVNLKSSCPLVLFERNFQLIVDLPRNHSTRNTQMESLEGGDEVVLKDFDPLKSQEVKKTLTLNVAAAPKPTPEAKSLPGKNQINPEAIEAAKKGLEATAIDSALDAAKRPTATERVKPEASMSGPPATVDLGIPKQSDPAAPPSNTQALGQQQPQSVESNGATVPSDLTTSSAPIGIDAPNQATQPDLQAQTNLSEDDLVDEDHSLILIGGSVVCLALFGGAAALTIKRRKQRQRAQLDGFAFEELLHGESSQVDSQSGSLGRIEPVVGQGVQPPLTAVVNVADSNFGAGSTEQPSDYNQITSQPATDLGQGKASAPSDSGADQAVITDYDAELAIIAPRVNLDSQAQTVVVGNTTETIGDGSLLSRTWSLPSGYARLVEQRNEAIAKKSTDASLRLSIQVQILEYAMKQTSTGHEVSSEGLALACPDLMRVNALLPIGDETAVIPDLIKNLVQHYTLELKSNDMRQLLRQNLIALGSICSKTSLCFSGNIWKEWLFETSELTV